MVTGIDIEDLKAKIDKGESFVLVNAADNVTVCAMDAVKGTYCIPKKQLLGQLGVLFSKSIHLVIYCVTAQCAEEAARELGEHGYTNVEYVTGTLVEWKDKGYPTESESGDVPDHHIRSNGARSGSDDGGPHHPPRSVSSELHVSNPSMRILMGTSLASSAFAWRPRVRRSASEGRSDSSGESPCVHRYDGPDEAIVDAATWLQGL